MSQSEEEQEVITIPGFEIRYNELPNKLLQKLAYYANKALKNPAYKPESQDKDACIELCQLLNKDPEYQVLGQGEWQCIIGKKFASSLTYDTGVMAFFDLTEEGKSILCFKSG